MMNYEFIPINENNYDLIKKNDLVAFTSTGHPEWRDVDHEHFGATIGRTHAYELTTGEVILLVMGRSISYVIKYEKLWLLTEAK